MDAVKPLLTMALVLGMTLPGLAGEGLLKMWRTNSAKLPWGAGVYGLGNDAATELDTARWDWVACHSADPGPEKLRMIDRLLELNPRQKYLFQLTGNFLSTGLPEHGRRLNFLDYHFDTQRRAALRESLQTQVRDILKGLSTSQCIAAFTFYEELPGNWGETHLLRPAILKQDKSETGPFPSFLKPYRTEIEQERGQPLVWDEATWRWLGAIYTETLNEIHRTIKTASGGKPVYYWLHNGMATLEMLPPDWTFAKAGGTEAAYWLKDIIRRGYCDGFMTYPSCQERWQVMMPLIAKNKWHYFAQLWHPGAFRLDTWDATLARTFDPNPWNQGFFFYCEGGGCARPSGWNDPDMGAAETADAERFVTPYQDPQEGPAMRIVLPTPKQTAFNHQYLSDVNPNVPLQGGKTYRWTVRIKTRDITEGPAEGYRGAVMMVRWRSTTAQVGESMPVRLTGTHDWQTYAGNLTAPADTVNAILFLGVWQSAGEAFFTKLSFKAEDRDAELTGNGSFGKFIAAPLKFDYWYHVDGSLTRTHCRYFCNKYQVGDDVVARYFKLAVAPETPAAPVAAGQPFPITVRVTNIRDTRYYQAADTATANGVKAVLKLPRGLEAVGKPELDKTSLAAGESAVWQWSVVARKPGAYRIQAKAASADMPGTSTTLTVTVD